MQRYEPQLKMPFDHAAMVEELKSLADEFSCLELRYLGSSIRERSIPLLALGNGPRRVLYVGAHHGMEWITSALLCKLIRELCQTVRDQKPVFGILPACLCSAYTIFFVPMLNPDGVEYQIHGIDETDPLYERVIRMNNGSTDLSRWQANARGVDLNHNYHAGFWEYRRIAAEQGIDDGAPTRYCGECPESEPEVSLLCDMIRFFAPWQGIMTLHTQGEEIYLSPHATLRTRQSAARLSRLTGYRVLHATGLASYGGLSDWCAEVMQIPAFTVECGKGCNPLPASDLFFIYTVLRKAFLLFPTIL